MTPTVSCNLAGCRGECRICTGQSQGAAAADRKAPFILRALRAFNRGAAFSLCVSVLVHFTGVGRVDVMFYPWALAATTWCAWLFAKENE